MKNTSYKTILSKFGDEQGVTGVLKYLMLIVPAFVIYSCIEPFSPPEVNNVETYLVVDGFLNIGGDSSTVILRNTQNTNDDTPPVTEPGALIVAESENGESYTFIEMGDGVYKLPPINANTATRYRLSIRRLGGREYLSDYVQVSITPPIDSVSYKLDQGQNAMLIYVNTHDLNSNSRFYRWKFEETYEYRTAYYSGLERDFEKRQVVSRPEDVSLCWRTLESRDIKLGSTVKLSENIIKEVPVNVIRIESNKLLFKYSILVKQYSLSREAFEYWTDLAKTTQGTGTLFDPQPSQVTGNIKSKEDARELVFGYFSASTEATKRIFINERLGSYPRCSPPDTIEIADVFETTGVLLSYYQDPTGVSYLLSSSDFCSDCRAQGGTIRRPPFWQ
ncbi:DUF4249 domain-containing protein [Dyadobacter bucti]|uniref:DUF4249 domain-containing protein n=1 Tax=Dyadobacter bucti TaxID=2572203 RepID=UPI001E4E9CD0|nr:DUF4249 domain-containing protein [Dyadobacter bucti]